MSTTKELQAAVDAGIPLITDHNVVPVLKVSIESLDPETREYDGKYPITVVYVTPGEEIRIEGTAE